MTKNKKEITLLKNYKFSLDIGSLILFILIMIPNFIWMFNSNSNDILKQKSLTPILDTIMSVFQVIFIAGMCCLKNKQAEKIAFSKKIIFSAIFMLCYFISWILYFTGYHSVIVLLLLSIIPCISFILYIIDIKNYISLIPAIIYALMHVIRTILNFII